MDANLISVYFGKITEMGFIIKYDIIEYALILSANHRNTAGKSSHLDFLMLWGVGSIEISGLL